MFSVLFGFFGKHLSSQKSTTPLRHKGQALFVIERRLHEASQGLLQEAVAKLRATLRVQFAARGVSAQESLEIHSGVRNPCPPSSLVRIAAVAANSILWNAGADMNSLADVVGIIFSDFTRGGAMDLLTGLGAKKRSDQSDPRLVVEAPFLSVVRIG